MEDDLKYQKWSIAASTGRILLKRLSDKTKYYKCKWALMEDHLKYIKWNISDSVLKQA